MHGVAPARWQLTPTPSCCAIPPPWVDLAVARTILPSEFGLGEESATGRQRQNRLR